MKPRLHLLLIAAFTCFAWAAIDGFQATSKRANAQPPSGSSKSDSGSRDHERGKFGDRGSRDWRSRGSRRDEEHRSDEKRGDEKSRSSGSSSSNSDSTSGSSRSTNSSSSASTTTTTATPSAVAATNLNLKTYATKLVTENDKNGNMILEPDEQRFLGRTAAAQDLDHDGKITIDEIVMYRSGGAKPAAAPASGTASTSTASGDSGRSGDRDRDRHREGGFGFGRHDSGSGSDTRSKTDDSMAKRVLTGTAGGTGKDADKRRSYRFSRPADKLPTGLPPWFTSRDSNKDGQVSMSEYSRSVTESMVSEFRRYDKDDDGMITAKEAAKQK